MPQYSNKIEDNNYFKQNYRYNQQDFNSQPTMVIKKTSVCQPYVPMSYDYYQQSRNINNFDNNLNLYDSLSIDHLNKTKTKETLAPLPNGPLVDFSKGL